MSLTLEQLQLEVRNLLARYVYINKMAFAAGQFDINLANDGFLLELLREVFDAPALRNLNAEEPNAAAVDLVDDNTGLAIQVTGSADLRKVVETLGKVVRHELYEKYPRIKIFVTTEKQTSYKQSSIDEAASDKVAFSAKNDILDSFDLVGMFRTYELDRLKKIASILRKHLAEGPSLSVDSGHAEAQERDLAKSYQDVLQRSVFAGVPASSEFRQLALSIVTGRFDGASQSLRRRVLLRAARSSAVGKNLEEAEKFLSLALSLPGADSDGPARARIAEARGDSNDAIRILRDATDSESRTTVLSILERAKGHDEALRWFEGSGTTTSQLTGHGIALLCQLYLRKGAIDTVRSLLEPLDEEPLVDFPYLGYLRGHVRLASVFPKPDQDNSLGGDPLAILMAKPILSDVELAERLDSAISDFQQVSPTLRRLELKDFARLSDRYVNWATLLHPYRCAAAISKLRSEVEDPQIAAQKIELALEFVDDFDVTPLTEFLRRREEFGGLDSQELRALVIIQLHKEDHVGIANTIAKHRVRCEEIFGRANSLAMEIRALTLNKQSVSAKTLLEENKEVFDSTQIARLNAQIAAAEGGDPTIELNRDFEQSKSVESLRALVAALYARSDYISLAPRAESLFAMTADPRDIAMAAKSFAAAGDADNFVRVMKAHPLIADRDRKLMRQYAWQLFQLGRFAEAEELARKLRAGADGRDYDLEIALAVERGRWEQVASPLAAMFDDRANLTAQTLMQGALLAQASGQGPLKDLLFAAVEKGAEDAQVLVGAYSIAIETGIEAEDEKPFEWFRRAVELSGPQGPIQQVELKDVLAKQSEWQTHSRKINDAVMNGEIPLIIAADALRGKIVDIILGSFARNSTRQDPRQRSVIPTFSGRRAPGRLPAVKRLALDISALLVLGWVRILPRVLSTFEITVIPAATFFELFEGQRSINQHQKSRLVRAEELKSLTAGRLKVIRSREFPADALDREIGVDLAGLIRAATDMNGVVVRPSPVHKLGGELIEADMSASSGCLTDMRELLAALSDFGAVDQQAHTLAKRYFEVQDRGWPTPIRPRRDQPLFLDGLAVSYLQTVKLLPAVVQTFEQVYIDSGTLGEADDVLGSHQIARTELEVIGFIRDAVKSADDVGKIVFGRRSSRGEITELGEMSTVHLLADTCGAELVVIDDRALNKEPFLSESSGRTVPIVTTLDLIEELEAREVISVEEKWTLRHQLRVAGAALIPIVGDELYSAAGRSGTSESPELRSMRESIGLARIRETPRFPSEIPWFVSAIHAVREAIGMVWKKESDQAVASSLSDAMFSLLPDPADWVACWRDSVPPDWVRAVSRTIATGFAASFDDDSEAIRKAYGEWVDSRVFRDMRKLHPSRFRAVIEQIKELLEQ